MTIHEIEDTVLMLNTTKSVLGCIEFCYFPLFLLDKQMASNLIIISVQIYRPASDLKKKVINFIISLINQYLFYIFRDVHTLRVENLHISRANDSTDGEWFNWRIVARAFFLYSLISSGPFRWYFIRFKTPTQFRCFFFCYVWAQCKFCVHIMIEMGSVFLWIKSI